MALFATACGAAAIGGGVAVVGVSAAALAYSCDESVSVTVFDGSTRGICDAEVAAESEGHRVVFSPCYAAYLGTGVWTVTARRGDRAAIGTVAIDPNRRCGEPGVHSLELSLSSSTAPEPVMTLPSGPPLPAPTLPTGSPPPPAATIPTGPTPPASSSAPAESAPTSNVVAPPTDTPAARP